MIVAWMLYASVTGALLVLAASTAERVLKANGLPVRFVWAATMALMMALTFVAPFRSADVASTVSALTPATSVQPAQADTSMRVVGALQRSSTLTLQLKQSEYSVAEFVQLMMSRLGRLYHFITRALTAYDSAYDGWIAAFAIGSTFAAIALLGYTYWRFAQHRARWPFMSLLGREVRLTQNVGPAAMGVAPAEIIIPQWVLARNALDQELVLTHESEHVRARDTALLLAACVAVVLTPWNAALWYMWSRLRLAVELDCDARVLRYGFHKPAYGSLLVDLSAHSAPLLGAMPAFSFGASHLEHRLLAMTARPMRFTLARTVAGSSAVMALLLAACESRVPAAHQSSNKSASAMPAESATPAPVSHIDSVVVHVDARGAANIATIDVAHPMNMRVARRDAFPKPRKTP